MSVEDFLNDHWGRRAVYIPGDDDKFEDLFSWTDVNDMVNYGESSPGKLKLIFEKKTLHPEALRNLEEWLGKGATLIVNSVQKTDVVLDRFAAALGRDLNTLVNINSYASCPAKQGFDIHFDGHDVFVVQMAGEKEWFVFEPTFQYPLEKHARNRTASPPDPETSAPYLSCTLSEGDVLYIPRGHWHYAVAVTPSIHLTVGPQARSGAEFLLWLAEQLGDQDEFFRQDFPIAGAAEFGGDRPDGAIDRHLATFRDRLIQKLRSEDLREHIVEYCMTKSLNRRVSVQLPQVGVLQETITPDTPFTLLPEEKVLIRYDTDSLSGVVLFRGAKITVRDTPAELLDALFANPGYIRGTDALAACPKADWSQLKNLLLTFYGRGLIRLADTGTSTSS